MGGVSGEPDVNWSLVSGISYLLLLGLVPAMVLWLTWRNTPPRSPAFGCLLLLLIVFPFILGGTWFALPYWLSRGPGLLRMALIRYGWFS